MNEKLASAIEFLQTGQKKEAYQILVSLVQSDPHNDEVWWWLSQSVQKEYQRIECLERVLSINPEHTAAKQALQQIQNENVSQAYSNQHYGGAFVAEQTDSPSDKVSQIGLRSRTFKWAFAILTFISLLYFIGNHPAVRWGQFPGLVNRNHLQSVDEIVESQMPTATPPGSDIADPNYQAGQIAYLAEDYHEVIRLMNLVLKRDSTLSPAYWYRGMAHFYLEEYELGLADMESALQIDSTYALAYADRGLMHINLGNEVQALKDWEKALSLDPTLAKVHHNYGATYFNAEKYFDSVNAYAKALSIDPTRAQTWLNRAEALAQLERFGECVDNAKNAIEYDEELFEAHRRAGLCYAFQGSYEEAVPLLNYYVQYIPDDPQAWFDLGYVQNRAGDPDQAIISYSESIKHDSTFYQSLINRAELYVYTGEYELALQDANAAVALGEIPAAYKVQGEALLRLGRSVEAEVSLDKALEMIPNYGEALVFMAESYIAQNKNQETIQTVNLLLEPSTQAPDLYKSYGLLYRGVAFYNINEFDKAIDDFSRSIAINPLGGSYYYRALSYEETGKIEAAIEDYKALIQLKEGEESIHYEPARQALERLTE